MGQHADVADVVVGDKGTEETPPRSRLTPGGAMRAVASAVAFVAYMIWDEALFSTPVVLSTAWLGAWPTFVVFVALYGIGGVVITLFVIRTYRRRLGAQTSRLERWVEREADAKRYRWARRLLLDSGWPGFAVASFALGPVATTWLLVATGRVRDEVMRTAIGSSAIFHNSASWFSVSAVPSGATLAPKPAPTMAITST